MVLAQIRVADITIYDQPYRMHLLQSNTDNHCIHYSDNFIIRLKKLTDSSDPHQLAHPDGGYLLAYTMVCTHMGCYLHQLEGGSDNLSLPNIKYQADSLVCGPCGCHGSQFDLLRNGLVIEGPASQPLPRLLLQLSLGGDFVVADSYVNVQGIEVQSPRKENWPYNLLKECDHG